MKQLFLLLLLAVAIYACKEDTFSPISKDDTIPKQVSNPTAQPLPGAAKISYVLPDDKSLAYVRAEYEVNGQKRETKSSFYQRSVLLEGFGNTNEYTVKLYSVSYGEKASAPVEIRVRPLEPAIDTVRRSLQIVESFGGINTRFQNPYNANIMIGVLRWDEAQKEWVSIGANYTALDSGKFSVRGQKAEPIKFGIFVRDRWNNHTDTLQVVKTPIYEEELDKGKIKDGRGKNWPVPQREPLPKNGTPVKEPTNLSSWKFDAMFDGTIGNNGFHTTENKEVPIWIPMDLGVKARLSRYKIWQRQSGYIYNHGNPHQWEIWGTNTPTDPNSWILLDAQIMIKPSGRPTLNDNSTEDTEVAANGQEYEFPIDAPPVRYIAWKHIDSWASVEGYYGHFHLSEMTIWGQIK
ncbi:DUF5126 domain-containing protein [Chitinophaga lutea]|uniref:DUF5126 domain-containing protein n=1 Tax=Chitinophaga lutea TaxID=2488634 RepID=A0A3N4PBE3_9BACT|nr:DUF5000 domain-containing lipoprotein [Chitinophaga lutea]RPE05963.1 DUF5126 domain-containing protein [Chitinophaga lutea]